MNSNVDNDKDDGREEMEGDGGGGMIYIST